MKVTEALVELDRGLTFVNEERPAHSPLPRRVAGELAEHLERYCGPDPDALVFTTARGLPP